MTTRNDDSPEFLTIRETAALLRISPNTAYTLVRNGSLPSWRAGRNNQRTIRIPLDGLRQMVAAQSAGGEKSAV